MIEKSNINEVKKNIEDHVGQKVLLRGSLGRNKSFEKEGTLINAYPNMFLVKTDNGMEKLSYRYVDVLTKTVELSVGDNGGFNSILNVIDDQHQGLTL
ncbi:MAG: Veg family protein [Clostridia bacterium]|nr:Veg family protein [Clostridia bacterium]